MYIFVWSVFGVYSDFLYSLSPLHVLTCMYYSLTLVMLNSFLGNMKIYLHFSIIVNTKEAQVLEILPHGRQGPFGSTQSIPHLFMACRRKEPRHQQPWYWPRFQGIFGFRHKKGQVKRILNVWLIKCGADSTYCIYIGSITYLCPFLLKIITIDIP